MKTVNAYERLRILIEFMQKFPTREQLIVFLSENACPWGEVSGVTTGYLDDEGMIHVQFTYGFKVDYLPKLKIALCEDNPSAEALRLMKITYVDIQVFQQSYLQELKLGVISDYQSAVGIPVTSRRLYGFTFTNNVNAFEGIGEYFEFLRSLLAFWENLNENRSMKRLVHSESENQELTARQKRILELIKEDRTNAAIASILGYSESLIRQETIIIYRKLGIIGRRELKKSMAS